MNPVALLERGLGLAGRLIWRLGLAPLVWKRSAGTPRILLYHACEPIETESDFVRGLGVNISPADFAAQMSFLARHYTVVGPDDLVEGTPPRAVVVTFDDGYESVVRHADPILERLGLPATVYLVTDVVGNGDLVWVNEMNWLLTAHGGHTTAVAAEVLGRPATATAPELVAAAVGAYDRDMIAGMLERMWAACPVERSTVIGDLELYLTWDTIREMRERRWTFGSHTATHPDLRNVADGDFDREIGGSIATVERELGSCTTFAYPFGFHDERAERHAHATSVATVMAVESLHGRPGPRRLARTEITATTPAGIFSELEVVAPAMERVRGLRQRLRAVA